MNPLLAAKIVFVVGVVMFATIILRKVKVLRALPQASLDEDSFSSFILDHFKIAQHHVVGTYTIVSRWLLRGASALLHGIKLISLKLESRATQWLSHVQKASEKAKKEKVKNMALEEMRPVNPEVKEGSLEQVRSIKSEEFFSILKDTPKHDKLKDKLSLIKEETGREEKKVK